MGASKRIAELVIKDISRSSKTKFASVRFGNVLGSRGSVIPTFQKQIEKGGPVTVTDPGMKRYFMTIPEAVQLVIQAGAITGGGETFVLDMGEMVKIDDLARDLIRLSGYEPDKDIEIVYTGTRPGEKLYEEIFTDMENMASTKHERIFISKKEMDNNYMGISKSLSLLLKKPLKDPAKVLELIMTIIPEYHQTAGTATNSKSERERVVV
jgi:FlaA1/EpsC-like NDP-sugar epimerase